MTSQDGTRSEPWPDRRTFLVRSLQTAAWGSTFIMFQALPGCQANPADSPPTSLLLSLSDIPVGSRRVEYLGGDPVEILRTSDSISARSLLCTHRGCLVNWREDLQVYDCTCHEGQFDAEGRPIHGPPPRPLTSLPVTVEGDTVIVGTATS